MQLHNAKPLLQPEASDHCWLKPKWPLDIVPVDHHACSLFGAFGLQGRLIVASTKARVTYLVVCRGAEENIPRLGSVGTVTATATPSYNGGKFEFECITCRRRMAMPAPKADHTALEDEVGCEADLAALAGVGHHAL